MPPSGSIIGWMDISPADLRKMRDALELKDKGVLDEMGVGVIHTRYADVFFPGTSVLHTRARYLLFVPWIYLQLARRSINPEKVGQEKRRLELKLVKKLCETRRTSPHQMEGIIGVDVYEERKDLPAQPADFVYWTALRTYRFVNEDVPPRATLLAGWDSKRIIHGQSEDIREDTVSQTPLAWFDVPDLPEGNWLDGDAELTFQLRRSEAQFLQRKLAERHPPCLLGMAASMLQPEEKPTAEDLWVDPFLIEAAQRFDDVYGNSISGPESMTAALTHAGYASSLARLVRGIYAAFVEQMYEQDLRDSAQLPLPDNIEQHRDVLRDFWNGEDDVVDMALELDLEKLRQDIRLPEDLLDLLALVQDRARRVRGPDDAVRKLLHKDLLEPFKTIEWKRKTTRARLQPRGGRERRAEYWKTAPGPGGINYRWRVVSRILRDIHQGLFHAEEE